jgi:elongation factor Ts
MQATIEAIKELRDRTGAGVSAVKEALEQSGNIDEAIIFLREKGLAKAAKRSGKQASNGILGTYIHNDSKLVVAIEIATETDFASRGEVIKQFSQDLALQIAAMNAEYVDESAVPADVLAQEKAIAEKEVEGKPAEIAAKIVEGKINKFYEQTVLMNQVLFVDQNKTVKDYLNEVVAKIGEKIVVTRFVKLQIGKELWFSETQE